MVEEENCETYSKGQHEEQNDSHDPFCLGALCLLYLIWHSFSCLFLVQESRCFVCCFLCGIQRNILGFALEINAIKLGYLIHHFCCINELTKGDSAQCFYSKVCIGRPVNLPFIHVDNKLEYIPFRLSFYKFKLISRLAHAFQIRHQCRLRI